MMEIIKLVVASILVLAGLALTLFWFLHPDFAHSFLGALDKSYPILFPVVILTLSGLLGVLLYDQRAQLTGWDLYPAIAAIIGITWSFIVLIVRLAAPNAA